METNYFWFAAFVLCNAMVLFILTANVSRLRLKHKVSVGDGDNKDLFYAIRAHNNGVEQVPIFACLVLALTLLGAPELILSILVIFFTFARVFHAYGMIFKSFFARRIGAGSTYLLQMFAMLSLAYQLID